MVARISSNSTNRECDMLYVFLGIRAIIGLISLACFIMIIIKMFQSGDTGLGIGCLVGIIVCGLGVLLAFIMGWVNVRKYGANNIMMLWTGCIVLGIIFGVAQGILVPGDPIVIPVNR
jgi:hypothetical protein